MKEDKVHLSVRKQRELDQLKRKIKLLEEIGDANPQELIDKYARKVAEVLSQAPESLRRTVHALAKVMAIPKSPRGRKALKIHKRVA